MASTTEEAPAPVHEEETTSKVTEDVTTEPSDDQVSLMSTPPNSPPHSPPNSAPPSPKPHGGSITSPVSPAVSVKDSSRSGGNSKPNRKPFLFGLLGKKKRAGAAAELAQPTLSHTGVEQSLAKGSEGTEEQIDWLENKGKQKKKGIFGFRKPAQDAAPAASWKKKNKQPVEPLSPSSNNNTAVAAAAAVAVATTTTTATEQKGGMKLWKRAKSPPPSPKRTVANSNAAKKKSSKKDGSGLDNIVVEETFVEEDPNAPHLSPRSRAIVDPAAATRRKAIIQDSWDFYRLICSLVCDRDRYQETFRSMIQKDPVYPYLNSLMSVNDNGNQGEGYESFDKAVLQPDSEDFQSMGKLEVAQALEKKANETMPQFVDICKSLAGSLGVEELGIGPIKEAATALRKAQRKYDGDLLKVTDYCRALIIVDDLAALLGLLELVRDSYGEYIRRVKLSTLKEDQRPKVGGYRDCIINMEINDHVCELQVHLRPLWNICKTAGYKHYKHCLEYKTDSFKDAYASLKGLDRKSLRELIALADDVTKPHPLDDVKADEEKVIMDYFALSGLYYKVGSYSFASIHFSRLAAIRKESFGALHPQTDFLYRYWVASLYKLDKDNEASMVETEFALEKVNAQKEQKELEENQNALAESRAETPMAEQPDDVLSVNTTASFWDTLSDSLQQGTTSAISMIVDPNRHAREEEAAAKAKIKASKKVWRGIRRERYPFLEGVVEETEFGDEEEREGVEESESPNVKGKSDAAVEEPVTVAAAPTESKADPVSVETEKKDESFESVPNDEKLVDEAEAQKRTIATTTEETLKEAPTDESAKGEKTGTPASTKDISAHVEEKKEDGDVSDPKETAMEEVEETSALDVFMDKACSLCVPSRSKA